MSKGKKRELKIESKASVFMVPVWEHQAVHFKSKSQVFEVEGELVEYHLRQPGEEPALKIRDKWYVLRIRDLATAILMAAGESEQTKGGE